MSNSFVGEGGRNFRFVIVGGKGQGNGAGASGVGAELSRPGLDGSLGVGSVVVMKILLVFSLRRSSALKAETPSPCKAFSKSPITSRHWKNTARTFRLP